MGFALKQQGLVTEVKWSRIWIILPEHVISAVLDHECWKWKSVSDFIAVGFSGLSQDRKLKNKSRI